MKPTQWLQWLWTGGPAAHGAPAFLPALRTKTSNACETKAAHGARNWFALSRSQTGAPQGVRFHPSVSVDARPHPNLLPRGEGIAATRFDLSQASFTNPVAGNSPNAETVSPSPWGEGRGEGGRASITRCSRIKSTIILLALALSFVAQITNAQTPATPSISPASGTVVPVSVSLADTTPSAVIRYTLDGSLPTVSSPVYYTPLSLTNLTMVRATAFLNGTNSASAYAYYVEPQTRTDMGYYRTVTNDNGNVQPLIGVTIAGASNVTCFTIEEQLPASVSPLNIGSGGQWLPNLNAIRWGPYTNTSTVTVSYRISGIPGDYPINGLAWADGRWKFVPSTTTATILSTVNTTAPGAPTPVAAPVIMPLALAAETALLTNAVVSTTNAGYNGTGFVSFTNNVGGSLQFNNVNGGEGGAATLLVRYVNGASARTGQLLVNGVTNTITFASTTTWTNWSLLTNMLTLLPGTANRIVLQTSSSGLANVDEITLIPSLPAVPADVVITEATPSAAIYYTLDGSLPTTNSTLYTGTVHLTNPGVVWTRAFLSGWLPSASALLNFGPAPTAGPATFTRTVQTNVP